METLCERVESDSFSSQDMESARTRFDEIRLAKEECSFSDEQLKEVSRLEARYTKAMAKRTLERIGTAVEGFLEGLTDDNE